MVKHEALNLVDMGSSPMMGVTSYDVIFVEVYIKSQLNIILLSRSLGATHHCSNLHDYIYRVPAHYCINDPALGGYIIWSVQFLLVTGMNNMDFFLSGSIYIEASLKPSLCSAQDLGATGNMDIREKYLSIFSFEQTRLTRRHQSL